MIEELGYDPRPDVNSWHGTPIPPCDNSFPATPKLVAIAKKMWWNGDPWTILRNRNAYLAHAMDWAAPRSSFHEVVSTMHATRRSITLGRADKRRVASKSPR